MRTLFEQQTALQFNRWSRWYDAVLGRLYFQWVYAKSITAGTSLAAQESSAEMTIVDLACGTGAMLARLREAFPHATLHGIDISPSMLRHARARLHRDARVHLYESSARTIPLPTQSVHLLFCIDAFHHFDEPQTVAHEIARVLHPRGVMILVDPAVETTTQKVIFRLLGPTVDHPYHYYTIAEMQKLYTTSHLRIEHHGFLLLNNMFFIKHNDIEVKQNASY